MEESDVRVIATGSGPALLIDCSPLGLGGGGQLAELSLREQRGSSVHDVRRVFGHRCVPTCDSACIARRRPWSSTAGAVLPLSRVQVAFLYWAMVTAPKVARSVSCDSRRDARRSLAVVGWLGDLPAAHCSNMLVVPVTGMTQR